MKVSLKQLKALSPIFKAARRLFKEWRVVAVLAIVYASLLAALLLFMSTKEATLPQVTLTLVFAALVPLLFFLLQAMILNYAQGYAGAFNLLRRAFPDSRRLALASIPLALLAVLCLYFLNRVESYYGLDAFTMRSAEIAARARWSSESLTETLQGPRLLLATLRLLIFGFVLPLLAARLWSATLGQGLLPTLKKLPHHLARALRRDAVLVYAAGFTLFGLVPYFLLFTHTPASSARVEFGLFVARLVLVFIFTLCGWVLTLMALEGETSAAAQVKAADANGAATLTGEAA